MIRDDAEEFDFDDIGDDVTESAELSSTCSCAAHPNAVYDDNNYDFPSETPDDFPLKDELGPFYFCVSITPPKNDDETPSWEYSSLLKTLFVPLNVDFPVNLTWTTPNRSESKDLYVRVVPIYGKNSFIRESQSAMGTSSESTNGPFMTMVRRTTNITNSPDDGDICRNDRRSSCGLDMHFPVEPCPDTLSVSGTYEFFRIECRGPITGSTRSITRATFKLEDSNGSTLGQRELPIRVCSKPSVIRENEEDKKLLSMIEAPSTSTSHLE